MLVKGYNKGYKDVYGYRKGRSTSSPYLIGRLGGTNFAGWEESGAEMNSLRANSELNLYIGDKNSKILK